MGSVAPAYEIIVPLPGIEPTSPALTSGPPGIKKDIVTVYAKEGSVCFPLRVLYYLALNLGV